jgi:hypothetical protein
MYKTIHGLGALAMALTLFSGGNTPVAAKGDEVPLTLTGCVIPGEAKDTFLITNVTLSGTTAAPTNAYYRLDDTKKLRKHVGERVEISGMADLDDHDKGTLKMKEKDGKVETEISSERQTVKIDGDVWGGSLGATKLKADINTYGFEVKSIKRLEGNCSSALAGAGR